MSEEERKLIEAAQDNKEEFVKLYDLHFDSIYKFLLSRVANVALAEDLTSETFMIAMQKIEKYEYTGKPFSAWLYRIAINEMNKHFRRKKVELKHMEKEWGEVSEKFSYADADLKEEEDKKEQLEQLKELNGAFRELTPKDQDLLALRFFEDLSYKEIADVLGISVNNVGVKLSRAQDRLQTLCNFSLS